MECALYYNLNINEDRAQAYAEAKRFLDEYYSTDFPEGKINIWTAYGSPTVCAETMQEFAAAGVQTMVIRFLSYDQGTQLRRFLDAVLPRL